jgi:hypothetical protein
MSQIRAHSRRTGHRQNAHAAWTRASTGHPDDPDANITTLIAALVLFQFGTGPFKGFAVTPAWECFSVFTGLVMCRLVFDYLLIHRKVKRLSI